MKVGVVGIGKLGRIHARIYKGLAGVKLAALSDINPHAPSLLYSPCDVPFYANCKDMLKEKIQAVSIATSTNTHYKIAKFFLENKVSCLVEKPITSNADQAKELLKIAKRNKVFLLVGMVERFNTAYQKIKKIIKKPKFIECHRLSTYPARSLDISVVLDLMIHDLDIILDLADNKIKKLDAVGLKVLSKSPDIANVRLQFDNGCIANITSSRISDERMRKIRVFFSSSYVSLDYASQEAKIYQKKKYNIEKTKLHLAGNEPLREELQYFIKETGKKKYNYALTEKSIEALEACLKIEKLIA